MTTAQLEALRDDLVGQVPLCPAPYAAASVRQAATIFFREAEIWRYTSEDIDIVKDTSTYKIALTSDMGVKVDVWRIDYAKDRGVVIAEDTYDLDYQEVESVWGYYLVFRELYVPTAAVTDGLDIKVVLAPAKTDGYVAPFQWNRWSTAIFYGAKKLMYSSKTRPWFDRSSLAEAQDEYAVQLVLARQETTQQFSADGALRAVNAKGWI